MIKQIAVAIASLSLLLILMGSVESSDEAMLLARGGRGGGGRGGAGARGGAGRGAGKRPIQRTPTLSRAGAGFAVGAAAGSRNASYGGSYYYPPEPYYYTYPPQPYYAPPPQQQKP